MTAYVVQTLPLQSSGTFWLQGAKAAKPVQVRCDMVLNGGGWAEIAMIAEDESQWPLNATTYEEGFGSSTGAASSSFVLPCQALDPGTHLVEMRVTMGKIRDYFRPLPGVSLCEMLKVRA